MKGVYIIIGDITTFFPLTLAFLYIIGFFRNNKAYKLFTGYIFAIAFIQLASYLWGRGWLGKPNLFLSHFYFISQFILLSFFYFELLQKKLIKIILLVVLGFLAYQYIEQPAIFFAYNSIGMSLTQAILVLYSIFYFYKSLSGKKEFIIVNIGVFFYLLSSTLIFASGNLMVNLNISRDTYFLLLNVNCVLYLVFQILILIEWYRNYRKRTQIE